MMVRKLSAEDGGDSANDAARIWVILAGARDPSSGIILDVDLARNMVVPEPHAWHDRYRVLLVVDVFHTSGKNSVHKVRKVLVTNSGHAVPDYADFDGGI